MPLMNCGRACVARRKLASRAPVGLFVGCGRTHHRHGYNRSCNQRSSVGGVGTAASCNFFLGKRRYSLSHGWRLLPCTSRKQLMRAPRSEIPGDLLQGVNCVQAHVHTVLDVRPSPELETPRQPAAYPDRARHRAWHTGASMVGRWVSDNTCTTPLCAERVTARH